MSITDTKVMVAINNGFSPLLWDANSVDEVLCVSTDYAKAMARRLASEEALLEANP